VRPLPAAGQTALRRERAAQRRARTLDGALGWLGAVDATLQAQLSVSVLHPVSSLLQSVQREAGAATAAREAVLTAKVQQRRLHGQCVAAVSDSSRRMRDAAAAVPATGAAVDSLGGVAQDLQRLSGQVLRMAQFWRQLHAGVGRLSSREVVRLVQLTRPRDDDPAAWELCTALKRRLVVYYAQWAAMADVCGECVEAMGAGVQAEAHPE
jgi:hypothetical protein